MEWNRGSDPALEGLLGPHPLSFGFPSRPLQFPEKTAKISSSRKTADLYPSTLSIRRQKGETDPMKIQFKVWLEKDQRVLFGEGRHQLLKAIEDYGSLVQAAKKMNMSYRAVGFSLDRERSREGQERRVAPDPGREKALDLVSEHPSGRRKTGEGIGGEVF
jgi:hypothetical protein